MYAIRTIAGPTAEPLTLAELRSQARVNHELDDPTLAGYLLAARQYLEQVCGRAFIAQTLEFILDQFPCEAIFLPRVPVASITSISYTDTVGSTQAVTSYVLEGETGRLSPAYGAEWPIARGTPGSVVIRFVAGEAQAPQPIKQAILLLASQWNEERESPPDNPTVSALIAPYRNPWI